MENRFNLIDEPWIPVADVGRVSLKEIFSNSQLRALGGNPVQKIAITKLLLAIAQSAATPDDDDDWKHMGWQGMADKCLNYLEKWHDRFFLYGERPFLQMPAIKTLIDRRASEKILLANTKSKILEIESSSKPKPIGAGYYPDIWAGNNTILFQTLSPQDINNQDLAMFIILIMNFSFGGKRVESNITNLSGKLLSAQYSAPAGPSLGGFVGNLHCFGFTETLLESIWFNLFSTEQIAERVVWSGVGHPPWEAMPEKESDVSSEKYSKTYMATLIALSRFALLQDGDIYYMDGIQYPKVADGWLETSLLINQSDAVPRPIYVNLDKKPWRDLSSWLSYSSSNGVECVGLNWVKRRIKKESRVLTVWVGGIKVTSNSGDQSVKQRDEFIESYFDIHTDYLGNIETEQYKFEIAELSVATSYLKKSVERYFHQVGDPKPTDVRKKTRAKDVSLIAEKRMWQLCERHSQQLIHACFSKGSNPEDLLSLRKTFATYAIQVFDKICPNDSARQMDAWAQARPNFSKYLKAD
ncbi:type I-E CRISPR-associated protein Cse1/CasA [Serratia sp. DD3]|uniref:type I-E CRISPR-associated protein Cse1/CasA n=1 Tax=Serratia sp. DD3 TaxID=1410619 RepID=UPI0004D6B71D|nr:type I-E CRISPR-associated protein Cse1/CasA [Serratia sp. DD3]KEY59796.1 CRISPR-associated protein CasA/Cse1 [Serratia sp. DD3]